MTGFFSKTLNQYSYKLPLRLIAQFPAEPRDSARLFVYSRETKKIYFDVFRELEKYLPAGAILVFNQTKVVPARLLLTKATGGRVKILYLGKKRRLLQVLSDRKLAVSSVLRLSSSRSFVVVSKMGKYYYLRPSFPVSELSGVLNRYGNTPIPPYIKSSPLKEKQLRRVYQAVFAKTPGSVAAPTASLHFTTSLIRKLRARGFGVKFVTLHVNLGTFAPLNAENFLENRLHAESYKIDRATKLFLNRAKLQGLPVVAVGTTVARTLESAVGGRGQLVKDTGTTDLFIRPGYRFRFIDGLITNFHVPRSSLLMLVSAFAGRKKVLDLYRTAVAKGFRFFSFGDAMLIL